MVGRTRRILWVVGGAALVLSAGVVLGLSSSAPAQQPQKPAATAAAPAPTKPGYVGAETCKGCHEEAYNKFARTRMGRIFLHQARNDKEATGCETCHGPGEAHAGAGGGRGVGGLITFATNDKTPVEKRNAVCLSCHTKGARIFWQGSAHESRDVACTNCHKVMEDVSPKNQLAKETVIDTCGTCHLQKRAQQMRSSHMPLREGKMTCTSCHNPHGTVTQALLKEPSTNATCYTCHAEKRGPFLWTHPPVQENCANCHDPHGSNHEAMLKMPKPRLCQQCHVETRHPTSPYGRDTGSLKFVLGRACADCHAMIHGSNHPSGFAFTR
jgi:DmsE family decaheme c-type cytochrome